MHQSRAQSARWAPDFKPAAALYHHEPAQRRFAAALAAPPMDRYRYSAVNVTDFGLRTDEAALRDEDVDDVFYADDRSVDAWASVDSASDDGPRYTCPSCGMEFTPEAMPSNGLLTCPECQAEFFAVAELSPEDRELAEREALEDQITANRLVDLRRNAVLIERRSLYRTRSYFIIGACVSVVVSLQLCINGVFRYVTQGFGWGVAFYGLAIGGLLWVCWFCLGKLWDINAELAIPVQRDPTTPPDFSTLSDGSQVLDTAAANLEKLMRES